MYLFKTGTFGVASAGRLAAALGRFTHYLLHPSCVLWIALLADDYKYEVTGANFVHSLLKAVWILVVFQVPLSWNKVCGGTTLAWVGYELDLAGFRLGLSASRADWLV